MTPTEILACRYDGPIPQHEIEAARAAERRIPSPATWCRVKAWKPAGVAWRMARVMVARRRAAGACHRDDLLRAGFTPAEIEMQGDAAKAQAGQIWNALTCNTCHQTNPIRGPQASDWSLPRP